VFEAIDEIALNLPLAATTIHGYFGAAVKDQDAKKAKIGRTSGARAPTKTTVLKRVRFTAQAAEDVRRAFSWYEGEREARHRIS
jgi:hypothetical protein